MKYTQSNISLDELLQSNKTGAFMKTKPQNNDLGGRIPLRKMGEN